MPYFLRRMCREDIAQVTEVDREAFPSMWPPANYRHELNNRLAHYIVACEEGKTVEETEVKAIPEKSLSGLASRVWRLFNRKRFVEDEVPATGREYVVGFAGFWFVADEAHITTIAVREEYRRQGIGELLLIALIDLATELNANIITLEVRASNTAALSLYSKYGFIQVGFRRGYYTDNREDAVLMTAENITLAPFQARLQRLKQAHSKRWGVTLHQLAR